MPAPIVGPSIVRASLARFLRACGVVRAVDLDRAEERYTRRERQVAAERGKRAAVEDKARRADEQRAALNDKLARRNSQLSAVEDKLDRARDALASVRTRLKWFEALEGSASPRLVGQLGIRAPLQASMPPASEDVAAEQRLTDVCPDYADAKAGWAGSQVPEGVRQTVIGNLQWFVPPDPTDEGSLSHRLLVHGGLPLDDVALIRQFVVGGVMLDIGANIGTTAIPRIVLGDFSRVYAAEPNTDNYRCLVGNVVTNGLSGRVVPDRVAISSQSGVVRIQRRRKMGAHRLVVEGAGLDESAEDVPCFTLDDWLVRLGLPAEAVKFVKVDTQGWDVHVLVGARALLARRDVVWQIEFSPSMMQRAGSSVGDLTTLIEDHFTHVRELGPRASQAHVAAHDAGRLLERMAVERSFVNLLLFNLDHTRRSLARAGENALDGATSAPGREASPSLTGSSQNT